MKTTVKKHIRQSKTGKKGLVRKHVRNSKMYKHRFLTLNREHFSPYGWDLRENRPIKFYSYHQFLNLSPQKWIKDLGGIDEFYIHSLPDGEEYLESYFYKAYRKGGEKYARKVATNELIENFIRVKKDLLLKFPITLYRVITVPDLSYLRINTLGTHWSPERYGKSGVYENEFLIKTIISNPNIVDWGQSIWIRIDFNEEEITLLKGKSLPKIYIYNDRDNLVKTTSGRT